MTVALPVPFCPNAFSLRQQSNQRVFASPFGGSEQTLDMLQDRWIASLSLPPTTSSGKAADRETFINAMRGQTQVCYLYHFGRPVPRGTMRGTPLAWQLAVDQLNIRATPGATLKAGDMLGVSGLLFQVAEDATANGVGDIAGVKLVNRIRKELPAESPVTWDRPTAQFRLVSPASVQYVPGYAEGVSLDFVEAVDLL